MLTRPIYGRNAEDPVRPPDPAPAGMMVRDPMMPTARLNVPDPMVPLDRADPATWVNAPGIREPLDPVHLQPRRRHDRRPEKLRVPPAIQATR